MVKCKCPQLHKLLDTNKFEHRFCKECAIKNSGNGGIYNCTLLGVLFISGVLTGRSQALHPIGMAYAALAAIGFSALVVCNRRMSSDLSPYDRSFVQLFISALIVLPYVLLMNRGIQLSWDLRSVLLTLLIGILQTGVAYIWYFGSIPEIPTQTFAVLGYLEPTLSVLCSALILREPMGLTGWIGALLIIGAAVVNELI